MAGRFNLKIANSQMPNDPITCRQLGVPGRSNSSNEINNLKYIYILCWPIILI